MKIILSILSIICFISCNTNQVKKSNWTQEEKELIFKECINYSLDFNELNLNQSNRYCGCTLRVLVNKFESKQEAEQYLIKNSSLNSIYESCENIN